MSYYDHSQINPNPYYTSPYARGSLLGHDSSLKSKSLKEGVPEPFSDLKIDFVSSLISIKTSLPDHVSLEGLEKEYDCFLKAEGRDGTIFFLLGVLIVRDFISLDQGDPTSEQYKRFILTCFSTVSLDKNVGFDQQSSLTRAGQKFRSFIDNITILKKDKSYEFEDEVFLAKFIVEKCKGDQELIHSIAQVARCSLIKFMTNEGVYKTDYDLYEKLTQSKWAESHKSFDKILEKFCLCLKYQLKAFSFTDTFAVKKEVGIPKDQLGKASLIEFHCSNQKFWGLLLRNRKNEQEKILSGDILKREVRSKDPIQSEVFEICSICYQKIPESLIFRNIHCGHKYCLYCLQDEKNQPILQFCIINQCPRRMDQAQMQDFLKKCSQIEKNQQTLDKFPNKPIYQNERIYSEQSDRNLTTHVPKKNNCCLCYRENEVNNPLFTNNTCKDTYCMACINKRVFNGYCMKASCRENMDLDELKEFFKAAGESINSITVRCSKCLKTISASQVFMNPRCCHLFCIFCVENHQSKWCADTKCHQYIDGEKLLDFKERLLIEKDQDLVKEQLKCLNCSHEIEIFYSQGSQPDYLKCSQCSSLHCFGHKGLMSTCLCFCPKCLGSLSWNKMKDKELKSCTNCQSSYCASCKIEMKDEACKCVEVRKNAQEFHLPVPEKHEIIQPIQTKGKQPRSNSCSVCKDFRAFPDFHRFPCDHKICEFCVLVRKDDFKKINGMKCPLCP